MAKKRKKKLPSLRSLEKKADRLLSEYIREVTRREYFLCPLCDAGPIQACFHFITRKRKIVRWSVRNVVGSCHRCNFIEQFFPDLSRAWFIRNRGVQTYLDLVDEARGTRDFNREDMAAIIKTFEDLIANEGGIT